MEHRYFVGVDGGGTKTALVALTPDGQTVASVVCGPLNYNFIGLDAALANLQTGVAALGLPVGSIAAVGIGDPSIDDASESPVALEFATHAAAVLGAPVYVRSDAYITLFALTGGKKAGVLIISGTGAMAIGEDTSGEVSVAGGWGRLTGDEGSGYYIGREGICAALRASDGVAPATCLTDAALTHFGVNSPRDLIPVFYGESEPDIAGFSRCVAECAEKGDAVAEKILLDAAEYLVGYASVLLERTHAEVLGVWGSVLCKNSTVRGAFEKGIRERCPHVTVCEPAISAERAAALYAAQKQKESIQK